MVTGIDSFKKWFKGFEEQYVIIGGTAWSKQYPVMVELFTRRLDAISLPEDAVLTPLPMEDDISSLSAILLDDDYYTFLKAGKTNVAGITVLDAAYLIPFKADVNLLICRTIKNFNFMLFLSLKYFSVIYSI